MFWLYRAAIHLLLLLTLVGCGGGHAYAPVSEGARHQPVKSSKTYRVRKGDTLYSIAWAYGLDYRQLAKMNHLSASFTIHPGQRLYVSSTVYRKKIPSYKKNQRKKHASSRRTNKPRQSKHVAMNKQHPKQRQPHKAHKTAALNRPVGHWSWPAHGRVLKGYSPSVGNKGIDIAGKYGQPVVAAAAGKVVYRGSGLRGYGNLIILKHNQHYLSAYAYNKQLLVREGAFVKRGQKIAVMGVSPTKRAMLHFEIRRDGKPVNPLWYFR